MIYKGAFARTICPMHAELEVIDDVDELLVAGKEGKIPDELNGELVVGKA